MAEIQEFLSQKAEQQIDKLLQSLGLAEKGYNSLSTSIDKAAKKYEETLDASVKIDKQLKNEVTTQEQLEKVKTKVVELNGSMVKTNDRLAKSIKKTTTESKKQNEETRRSKKSVREVLTEYNKLIKSLRDQKKLATAAAITYGRSSQEYKTLADGASKLDAKLKILNTDLRNNSKEQQRNLIISQAQKGSYNQISAALAKNIDKWKKLSSSERENSKEGRKLIDVIKRQDAALKNLDTQMGRSQRHVGNYGRSLVGVGKNLLGAFGVVGGVFALARVLQSTAKIVVNFDRRMTELSSITSKTKEELAELKEEAIEFGSETAFTADEVVGLQIELAKLGFELPEISKSTESIINFSVATATEVPRAAKVAGAALRGFNLDAEEMDRVVSVLGVSTTKSALDFTKLETAFPIVQSVAKNANVSLERTTAILGVLADRGLEASTSATGVRNIFLELSKQGLTYNEALTKIQLSTDKNKTAQELFGKRSATTAIILADNSAAVDKLENSLFDVSKELQVMADVRLESVDGKLKLLKSAWEGLILSIEDGDGIISMAFKEIIDGFTDTLTFVKLLNNETSFSDGVKNFLKFNFGGRDGQRELIKNLSEIADKKKLLENTGGVRGVGGADEQQRLTQLNGLYIKLRKELNSLSKDSDEYKQVQEDLNNINEKRAKLQASIQNNKNEEAGIFGDLDDGKIEKQLSAIEQQKKRQSELRKEIELLALAEKDATDQLKEYHEITSRLKSINDVFKIDTSSQTSAQVIAEKQIELGQIVEAENIRSLDAVAENEKKTARERLDAIEELFDLQSDFIRQTSAVELSSLEKKKDDGLIAELEYQLDRQLIIESSNDQIEQLSISSEKRKKSIIQDEINARIAFEIAEQQRLIKAEENIQKVRLANGEITEQEYTQIIFDEEQKRLQVQIDNLKAIVDATNLTEQVKLEAKQKISQELMALDDLVTKNKIDNLNEESGEEKTKADTIKAAKIAAIEGVSTVFNEIFEQDNERRQEEFDRALERATTSADREIDSLQRQKEQGLITEQEFSVRKEEIDKNLANKERQLKIKKAKADKGAALGEAAISSALAIIKQLAATPLPLGAPFIAAVAIASAIQTAIIAARPIPKFGKGTKSAPEGRALVGEAGRELMIHPSGGMEIVHGPSIRHLTEGTVIKNNLETEQILRAANLGVKQSDNNGLIGSKLDRIEKAIKNQKSVQLNYRKGNITDRTGSHHKNYYNRIAS